MRRALPVLLALVLAGCTSGTAKPTASSSPTRSASAVADQTLVVAVRREGHPGIWVYAVDRARRAHPLRHVTPPDSQGTTWSWAVAPGGDPDVCVAWRKPAGEDGESEPDRLTCYGEGQYELGARGVKDVFFTHDGRALVFTTWERGPSSERQEIVLAPYQRAATGSGRRFLTYYSTFEPDDSDVEWDWGEKGCVDAVENAVPMGGDQVLAQCQGANDDPGTLAVLSMTDHDAIRDVAEPGHQGADGYSYFTEPTWADGKVFLALEGQYCEIECADKQPPVPRRAVLVDLRTGRVVEVVATPAKGRSLEAVTGGAHGIVYVTYGSGRGSRRVYVRWPGEKHGVQVSGLPSDLDRVIAQP